MQMKKKLLEEKASIAAYVAIVLFAFIMILSAIYMTSVSIRKSQLKTMIGIKNAYEKEITLTEKIEDDFIKIYTVEQLRKIGTGETVEGKVYGNDSQYLLMNDINFEMVDDYWLPIGDNTTFHGKFDGNGYNINVTYADENKEKYTVSYNEDNNYSEPEFTFTIIPKLENGTIASNANIYIDDQISENIGQQDIVIKRTQSKNITAKINIEYLEPSKTIYVTNPNKITNTYNYNQLTNSYELELLLKISWVTFTINPTPSDATVTINGTNTKSVTVISGTTINWSVNKPYYIEQTGTYSTGRQNHTEDIELKEKLATIALGPSSISTTGSVSNESKALKKSEEEVLKYANGSGETCSLTWHFTGFDEIDPNAKIVKVHVRYRIATTTVIHVDSIIQCGSNVYGTRDVKTAIVSTEFGQDTLTIPTVAEIKQGIDLTLSKYTSKATYMRWYGATLEIQYINP